MKFKFVEKENERSYAGFFAVFNQLLSAVEYAETLENFENNICIHVPSIDNHIYQIDHDSCFCSGAVDIRTHLVETAYLDPSNAHVHPSPVSLKKKHDLLRRKFAFRKLELQELAFMAKPQERILGIHLRGTDKYKEVLPPSRSQVLKRIKKLILENEIEGIYLATDDARYDAMIQKHFSELVINSNRGFLGSRRKPTHLGGLSEGQLAEVDHRALMDAIQLSRCSHFLFSYSNLSHFALVLGANTHVLAAPIQFEPQGKKAELLSWLYFCESLFLELSQRLKKRISAIMRSN